MTVEMNVLQRKLGLLFSPVFFPSLINLSPAFILHAVGLDILYAVILVIYLVSYFEH